MSQYCCNSMKGELERTCDIHRDRWACGDNVVHFNPKTRQYGLMIRDGGRSTYPMTYCPWCGTDLVKHEKMFAVTPEEAVARRPGYDVLRSCTSTRHEAGRPATRVGGSYALCDECWQLLKETP